MGVQTVRGIPQASKTAELRNIPEIISGTLLRLIEEYFLIKGSWKLWRLVQFDRELPAVKSLVRGLNDPPKNMVHIPYSLPEGLNDPW